jgi:hypothetical protein
MAIDYAALLKRYMQHVRDCQGTTFVEQLPPASESEVEFTPEECAELIKIADRLD